MRLLAFETVSVGTWLFMLVRGGNKMSCTSLL